MPEDFLADAFGIEEEDLVVEPEVVCPIEKNHPRKSHFHGPGSIITHGTVKWEVKRGRPSIGDSGDSVSVIAGQKKIFPTIDVGQFQNDNRDEPQTGNLDDKSPNKRSSTVVRKNHPHLTQLFEPNSSERSILAGFLTSKTISQWIKEKGD